MTYNLTAITSNGDSLLGLMKAVNGLSGINLFAGVSFVLYLLLLVPGLKYGWKAAMLGAGGIMSMISALMYLAGLVPQSIMFIYFILLGTAIFISIAFES